VNYLSICSGIEAATRAWHPLGWKPLAFAEIEPFPAAVLADHHTQIAWRGKPATDCPDGPRYKALGNSMAVPVMHWIGQRLQSHLQKV